MANQKPYAPIIREMPSQQNYLTLLSFYYNIIYGSEGMSSLFFISGWLCNAQYHDDYSD